MTLTKEPQMKSIIAAVALALTIPFVSTASYAADTPAKKPTLGECAAKTKGMSKDEASKFKSECMKGGSTDAAAPVAAKKPTLGECAAKTKGMSKDEANKFKSECMKGG